MEQIDYLNLRTTNINIRISPLLKSALIEKGGKMGINLSDYISHVLTRELSGQNITDVIATPEYKALAIDIKNLKAALQYYESLAEPFKHLIGQEVTVQNKKYALQKSSDIFWLMAQTFKTK